MEWVDLNLIQEMGQSGNRHRWRYLFRETAYGIWHIWNRRSHNDTVQDIPYDYFAKLMVQRVDILLKAHATDVDDVIT